MAAVAGQQPVMTSLANSFPYYGNLPTQTDFYGAQLGMNTLPHLNSDLDKKKRHDCANTSHASNFAGKPGIYYRYNIFFNIKYTNFLEIFDLERLERN